MLIRATRATLFVCVATLLSLSAYAQNTAIVQAPSPARVLAGNGVPVHWTGTVTYRRTKNDPFTLIQETTWTVNSVYSNGYGPRNAWLSAKVTGTYYSYSHEDTIYYVSDTWGTGGIDLNGPTYWNNSTTIKNDTAAIKIDFDPRADTYTLTPYGGFGSIHTVSTCRSKTSVPCHGGTMDSSLGMGGMFGYGVYQPGATRLTGRQFSDGYYREEMIWDLTLAPDADNDGIPNTLDRCPLDQSFSQADFDGDGIGDYCDRDPKLPPDPWVDTDGDGFADRIERAQGTNPADPDDSMLSKQHKPGPITLYSDQPISRNWPTVILTHGLQARSLAGKQEELWTSSNAAAVGAGYLIDVERALRLGNATLNVIQLIWDDAYQASAIPQRHEYVAAWEKYPNAAEAVARDVTKLLGKDYAQPIHFIGHSLGTAVNARAAALILAQLHNVKRAQVTALDRPHHINKIPGFSGALAGAGGVGLEEFETIYGFGSTFFFSNLGRLTTLNPNLDLRLDNYYSDPNSDVVLAGGVGDIATPSYTLPTYNHPELIEPNDLQNLLYNGRLGNNHTGVHQWYRWTIAPNLMGTADYCNADGTFNVPSHIDRSLNPCRSGWYWALNGPSPGSFPAMDLPRAPAPRLSSVAMNAFRNIHGCSIEGTTGMNCVEASSAFGVASIQVPADAEYLSFEYKFGAAGDGDYASVMVDDVAVWTMAQENSTPGEFVRTPPIRINGRRGGRQLTVALYGVGTVNASVSIRNLEVEQSDTPSPGIGATLALSKQGLNFGAAIQPGAAPAVTSAQTLRLTQSAGPAVNWIATADQPWITVSPSSGTGAGDLTVSINSSAAALATSGTLSGTITVTATGALNTPSAAVVLKVMPAVQTAAPFGTVDTPLQGATGLTGSIAVTGWALDDVGVTRVRLLRNPVSGEGSALVPIGDAVLIDGARPDVATANAALPRNTRAGWGYLLLTNFLPNEGNGSFTLHAYADDVEGRTTLLGSRVIGVANATAINPFGAIDTPGQGESISGVVNNFGWVLGSGGRRADAPSGGTVTVFIDGSPIGSPVGWSSRADLSRLFPATRYPGVSSALAVHTYDTRTLADGVHTIAWGVTDNQGNSAGVGSRYFTVANGGAPVTAALGAGAALRSGPPRDEIRVRRGFDSDAPWRSYGHDASPVVVHGEELDRFEIQIPDLRTGHLVNAGATAGLAIGSHVDPVAGTFTWQPGAGFVGFYDFAFDTGGGVRSVRIVLHPKGSGRVGPQVIIDAPGADSLYEGGFHVGGWAADLDSASGTGIDTVHVWAYPVRGGSPIFLGMAEYGSDRPDVGAVYGDRFQDSGFGLNVGNLLPGTYDIAVFGFSVARGGFLPARTVRVTVR